MTELIIIIVVVMAVLMIAGITYLSLRQQKNAVMDEVNHLSLRLTEMELNVPSSPNHSPMSEGEASDDESKANSQVDETPNLSAMTNEELFAFLSKTIKEEEMFRSSDLNRNAVMKRFSLSAARIGNAFMRGGGMGLPEFVRNCRLDYACRLMVEQPEMPFTEVGSQSGYQRTTTFYHDFKDRFGIPPTEYRKKELKKRLTSDE